MAYDLSSHPLLSEDAADLGAGHLSAHVSLAADLLGLAEHETTVSADAARLAKAKRALALQVNYQIVHDHDAEAHSEEEIDGLRRRYGKGSVSPSARRLADEVLDDISKLVKSFEVMRSRR